MRFSLHLKFLFLSLVLYVSLWSTVDILKMFDLNIFVFDAGVSMQNAWYLYPANWGYNPNIALLSLFSQSSFYFVVSPLSVINSFSLDFIVQSILVGSGAIPLFFIARKLLDSDKEALLISISYLIYFPSSGLNWYDIHWEVMFIPLFLTGFYLYLINRYYLSFLLLFLSGLGRYPFLIFPILFGLLWIVDSLREYRKTKEWGTNLRRNTIFTILLSIFSIAFLTLQYIVQKLSISYTATDLHSRNLSINLLPYLPNKIITIFLIFLPLLFIPLISKKWSVFYMPYIIVILFWNFSSVLYPVGFLYQYPLMIVPFVFIGLIDGITILRERGSPKISLALKMKFSVKKGVSWATIVLTVSALLGLVFLPYGPLSNHSGYNYQGQNFSLDNFLTTNTTIYNNLESAISKIPKDNPYVLTQMDIPEIYPRPLPFYNTPLTTTFTPFGNVSLNDFKNNSIPLYANGKLVHTQIDYTIAYTNSYLYYLAYPVEPYWIVPNMKNLTSLMLQSGMYHIAYNQTGIILIERNGLESG